MSGAGLEAAAAADRGRGDRGHWQRVFVWALGVAVLGPVAAAAAGEERRALIEEFLTAEPSYVQRRGEFELSSAFDCRQPSGDWSVPVLVEYGITDRLEAELETGYVSVAGDGVRDHGLSDVELGLHYALRPEVADVAVTLGVDCGFPTGDDAKGLGSGRTEVEFFGIAGVSLGRAELHVTGRLALEEELELGLDAAAVCPRGDFRFVFEANALPGGGPTGGGSLEPDAAAGMEEQGAAADEDLWVVMTPGLFHRPGPEIEYGVGVPIGLTRAAPDWGVIGRLTIEFDF